MNGRKWMPQDLPRRDNSAGGPTETSAQINQAQHQKLAEAIISTLAFFSLYSLPLTSRRIYELLSGIKSTQVEVDQILSFLVQRNQVVQHSNLFALKRWDDVVYNANQLEMIRKWRKIDRYFSWLALLPFVRQISIINSLALGTADSDSDIDFFVIIKPNRLYFVRSVIIILFRFLGVYKTRKKIKDRFCFGFFITEKSLQLQQLRLLPEDPYFMFWFANMRPILGQEEYLALMKENAWINTCFPNFELEQRFETIKRVDPFIRVAKFALEVLLWVPIEISEPVLRRIHITHTFKLAENNTKTSTTIANAGMLKLHADDVRARIAYRYNEVLQNFH